MGSRVKEGDTGWKEQGRRRIRYKKEEVLTTFFVSNFPEGTSSSYLRELFFPHGKLRDAFIPKKKDRFGASFAFIRYADVENVEELEKQLKQLLMGNLKLSVNVAIFNRDGEREYPNDYGNNMRNRRTVKVHTPDLGKNQSQSDGVKSGMPSGTGTCRSYKEVLSNGISRSVTIKEVTNKARKLDTKEIILGSVKDLETLEVLRKNFESIGRPEIDLIYMGGLTVLLIFPSHEVAEHFINKETSTWKVWFEKTSWWDGSPHNINRLAWLSVRGVPPQLWDSSVMEQIWGLYGRVLLNTDVSSWDNDMSKSRSCVLTTAGHRINEKIELRGTFGSIPVWVSEVDSDWCPDLSPGFKVSSEGEETDSYGGSEFDTDADDESVFHEEREDEIPDLEVLEVDADAGIQSPVNGLGERESLEVNGDKSSPTCTTKVGRVSRDAAGNSSVIGSDAQSTHALPVIDEVIDIGPYGPDGELIPKSMGREEVNSGPSNLNKTNQLVVGSEQVEPILNNNLTPVDQGPVLQGVENISSTIQCQKKSNMGYNGLHAASSRSRPGTISLKLKDRLWGHKHKSQAQSKGLTRTSSARSGDVGESEGDSLNQPTSSTEKETLITAEVGGLVGYNMQGFESKISELVNGEVTKKVNQ